MEKGGDQLHLHAFPKGQFAHHHVKFFGHIQKNRKLLHHFGKAGTAYPVDDPV